MYEELVELLREAPDDWPDADLHYEAADAIEELSKRVEFEHQSGFADGQIAANRKKSRWILVTERSPEKYVNVLCHLRSLDRQSEYYSIDHLMEDGQWWKAANSWKYEVTHWMPLPAPPKEEV